MEFENYDFGYNGKSTKAVAEIYIHGKIQTNCLRVIALMKHHGCDQSQLVEESIYVAYTYTSLSITGENQDRKGLMQSRNVEAEAVAEVMEGPCFLACFS